MNANPILHQPNPNSGNAPCYLFNIQLYPCPDPATVPPSGINNSGYQHPQQGRSSFRNSYLPQLNGWNQQQRPLQPQQITQNGGMISIPVPVPVPNSIYQSLQHSPDTYNNQITNFPGYSLQQQFPNNGIYSNCANAVPEFVSMNSNNNNNSLYDQGPRRQFSKSKTNISTRKSSRIPCVPPLPPPPPPQYFSSTRRKQENFESPGKNIGQLHPSLLEELKDLNSKRYFTLGKSSSYPHYRSISPAQIWKASYNKGDERNRLEDRTFNREKSPVKFLGGDGDSAESYSPTDISEEKLCTCDCTVCKGICEEQKKKVPQCTNRESRKEDTANIPHIPPSILWKQMNSFRNNEELRKESSKKFIDKATCPMKPVNIDYDYDDSPVWEFQRRDGHMFHRILSPSKTKNISTQCDLDLELPSTEILFRRAPKNAHSSPSLSERSPTYRINTGKGDLDQQEAFVDYMPTSRQKLKTRAGKKSFQNRVDHNHNIMHNNESEYEEDVHECSRDCEKKCLFAEKSNRVEYLGLEDANETPVSTTSSSTAYRSRRPTFQEVMEYLEKADEQEKHQFGLQCKSSMKNSSFHLKRGESNSNDGYPFHNEEPQYQQDFQANKPVKKVGRRKPLNYSSYKESYTEIVCRRPPVKMFPEDGPGPLEFPKHALAKVLNFLDSNIWQQVLDGFRLAVRLARHHPQILREELGHIVWKSEKHLASLKSAVSRAALASFTEFVVHVPTAMEPYIDKILGKILLKSMDCNKFLRWECRNVLNAVVYSFPIAKSLSCLETGFKHKSGMVRATISIMMSKWVRKVGVTKVMANYAPKILPMIINLLQERGWEARAGAKDALTLLFTHPNFMSVLRNSISYEKLVEASRRCKCIRDLMEEDCLNFRI